MSEDDCADDEPLLSSFKGRNLHVKLKKKLGNLISKVKLEEISTVTKLESEQGSPVPANVVVNDSEDDECDDDKPLSFSLKGFNFVVNDSEDDDKPLSFSLKGFNSHAKSKKQLQKIVSKVKTEEFKTITKSEQVLYVDANDSNQFVNDSDDHHYVDANDSNQVANDSDDDHVDEKIIMPIDNQCAIKSMNGEISSDSEEENDDNDDKPLAACLPQGRSANALKTNMSRICATGNEVKTTTWRVYTKRKNFSAGSVSAPNPLWKKLKQCIELQRLKDDADAYTDEDSKDDSDDSVVVKNDSHDDEEEEEEGEEEAEDDTTDSDGEDKSEIEDSDEEFDVPLVYKASKAAKKRKSDIDGKDERDEGDEFSDDDYDDVDYGSSSRKQSHGVRSKQKSRKSAARTKVAKAGKNVVRKVAEAKKSKSERQKIKEGQEGTGQKWTTFEHNGVVFPSPYTPHGIKILYSGKPVDLTPDQEEVATMFATMRETEYVTKPTFLANFWDDWSKLLGPNHVVKDLEGCNFAPIYDWLLAEKEKKKSLPLEEKKRLKEEKQKQEEKYMWAVVDGVKEKVGNFRVEPPGLFRGRGEHPKMGKLKRRIIPEDIVINIGADAPIPECPIPGHRWKEVRHDNTVTWLAYWNDPINVREQKYVFLAPSSTLKSQSDKEKYEKARMLKDFIGDIRETYTKNFASSDLITRQIAVATYLIDRLALRAGNEKEDDEADTVGCCSLKVEHVKLVPPSSIEFDFLGKDSIRYFNTVEVVKPVYEAIGDFTKSKSPGDDLFDKLDTYKLNAHLKGIMPQLTAKVFRTYNASITLDILIATTKGHFIPEKIAAYQRANKEVAILCNHQRTVSKLHGAQMDKLNAKFAELQDLLHELEADLDLARKGKPPREDEEGKPKRNQNPEALEKKIAQTRERMEKVKLDMSVKDDLKTVALGTSKINYLDPRITVAWCKRHEVPIEKIFNKSLLAKFSWAMDAESGFRF